MAGLNFVGNAVYGEPVLGKKEETAEEHEREAGMVKGSEIDNVAQFELPLWLLGQCASVKKYGRCWRGLTSPTPHSMKGIRFPSFTG